MESVTSSSSLKNLAKKNKTRGHKVTFMSCSMLLAALVLIIAAWRIAGLTVSPGNSAPSATPFCERAPLWPGVSLLCFEPLDINSATIEELDQIPGVGARTAAKLINFRMLRGFLICADEISEAFEPFDHRFEYLRNFITTKPGHFDLTVQGHR